MPRIPAIKSERVDWCCRQHGITIDELAKQLKIGESRFGEDALNDDGLTFNQLKRLAEFFNRGVLFFLESGPIDVNKVHSPQFRTLTNQKPDLSPKVQALIERVERQRDVYVSLLEDLDADPPNFTPPRIHKSNAKNTASSIRKWLGLDDEDDFEGYRQAVHSCGVVVFRSNGYAGKWQVPSGSPVTGFSLYDANHPLIFVKRLHPESRQTFTLMHELAHLLLHKRSFIDVESDLFSARGREREANEVAGLVLVPDELLDRINDSERPTEVLAFDGWLKPYKDKWGVSGEVILRRMKEEARLTQREYDEYRNIDRPERVGKGTRAYRHREPQHVFGLPFVRTVIDALNSDQITLSKASTYLDNLKVKDVHSLEEHLANL